METILQIKNLEKIYGKNQAKTKALKNINIQIAKGEFIGVMGASGSGKTTLLNCIATAIKPTSGEILLNNEDINKFKSNKLASYRGKKIGYLFQNFELIDNLTGRENIMLPMAIHNINDTRYLDEVSKYLEVDHILDKFPYEMSGGEKQRIAATRALILNPEIVLADEPTGALDTKNAKILMDKLVGVNKDMNTTVLMVTHDMNAASYCSRILFIQDGVVFHELRKKGDSESQSQFYDRIVKVMAQLGGGSVNVL